jgi:hypothetical protein
MLTRRMSLLLPLLAAGCGGSRREDFPPLRYDYLAPLPLNVASIQIEQRYVPSGVAPDVSQFDPVPPVQALRAMAEDRLQGLGSADLAVFLIKDASLTRQKDTISGNFAVELDIYNTPTNRAAYAQAGVSATYTGDLDDLPARLYDMTKDMMDRMNVEFEYQMRRSLGSWFLSGSSMRAPVEAQPLNPATSGTPPAPTPMPGPR